MTDCVFKCLFRGLCGGPGSDVSVTFDPVAKECHAVDPNWALAEQRLIDPSGRAHKEDFYRMGLGANSAGKFEEKKEVLQALKSFKVQYKRCIHNI